MQNRVRLLILLLMVAVAAVGCGGNEVTLDLETVALRLKEAVAFADELALVSEQAAQTIYLLDAEDVVAQQVYMGSGATAEEIAVFEATDSQGAKRIQSALRQRVQEQIDVFRDYLPSEVPKLENAYLKVMGKYVIYCVSPDSGAVEKAVNSLFELVK